MKPLIGALVAGMLVVIASVASTRDIIQVTLRERHSMGKLCSSYLEWEERSHEQVQWLHERCAYKLK